ncbi:MAG: hypothetical protein KC546_00610 [Anaerolineae bacterium]|nr:hypothetical protein [Anaerolineae bacterium]
MNLSKVYEREHTNHQYEIGQGLIAYALVIALVAATVVLVLANVGSSVADTFETVNCTFVDPANGACIEEVPTEEPDPDPCPDIQISAAYVACRTSNNALITRIDVAQCSGAQAFLTVPFELELTGRVATKPDRQKRSLGGTHALNTLCEGDYSSPLGTATFTIYHEGTSDSAHSTTVTTTIQTRN